MLKLLSRVAVEIALQRIEKASLYAGGEEIVLVEGKEFHILIDPQKKAQKCYYLADGGSRRYVDIKNLNLNNNLSILLTILLGSLFSIEEASFYSLGKVLSSWGTL